MAKSDHDDLADALARLAGGDIAPSERDHDAPVPTPPKPPPPPKPAFRPTSPTANVLRPSAPPPRAPAPPPSPVVARPQRPAVPPSRPLAPPPPNLTPPEPPGPIAGDAVVEDDDVVFVPPHDPSVFVPKRTALTTAEAQARAAHRKRVEFRRTLIPVLLSCGVIAIAFAVATVALGPDSISATLPHWVVPTLVSAGVVLLVLAGLNMASVRSLQAAEASAKR